MQKVVIQLDLHYEKDKTKALKTVSAFARVDSIEINLKDQKLTVTGSVDPMALGGKLRKTFNTKIISVGQAKEAQKMDDNKKDDENNKDDNKSNKNWKADQAEVFSILPVYYPRPYCCFGRSVSVEEDPTGCVILEFDVLLRSSA